MCFNCCIWFDLILLHFLCWFWGDQRNNAEWICKNVNNKYLNIDYNFTKQIRFMLGILRKLANYECTIHQKNRRLYGALLRRPRGTPCPQPYFQSHSSQMPITPYTSCFVLVRWPIDYCLHMQWICEGKLFLSIDHWYISVVLWTMGDVSPLHKSMAGW